jgi:hypothetical protein
MKSGVDAVRKRNGLRIYERVKKSEVAGMSPNYIIFALSCLHDELCAPLQPTPSVISDYSNQNQHRRLWFTDIDISV